MSTLFIHLGVRLFLVFVRKVFVQLHLGQYARLCLLSETQTGYHQLIVRNHTTTASSGGCFGPEAFTHNTQCSGMQLLLEHQPELFFLEGFLAKLFR